MSLPFPSKHKTRQGTAWVQPTLCLYKALDTFFLALRFSGNPDTVCQVHHLAMKGSNADFPLETQKLYFRMMQVE